MTFQIEDTNLLLVLGLSCSLCTLIKFSREDLLFQKTFPKRMKVRFFLFLLLTGLNYTGNWKVSKVKLVSNNALMTPRRQNVSRMVFKQRMPGDIFQWRESFRCSVAACINEMCWKVTDYQLLHEIKLKLDQKETLVFGYQGNQIFCSKLPITWRMR